MKNKIRNDKKYKCRIYLQDRYTNKIWYYDTKWPIISYNYLELYLKENNKKFLYITKIGCEFTNTKSVEHEKTQKSMWK